MWPIIACIANVPTVLRRTSKGVPGRKFPIHLALKVALEVLGGPWPHSPQCGYAPEDTCRPFITKGLGIHETINEHLFTTPSTSALYLSSFETGFLRSPPAPPETTSRAGS